MSSSSPASQAEATTALRALFTAFPADRGETHGLAATYLIAVEGYSEPAIRKAVTRLIRGEFDWFGGRFLPTTAELSRACRYCEDLIAPPKRPALAPPGEETRTEEEWARRAAQATAARERFGIKPSTGETVVERDAMPEALKAERDKAVQQAASKLKGSFHLSDEALAIFRKDLAQQAVGSPDEQYDDWLNPTPNTGRAA